MTRQAIDAAVRARRARETRPALTDEQLVTLRSLFSNERSAYA